MGPTAGPRFDLKSFVEGDPPPEGGGDRGKTPTRWRERTKRGCSRRRVASVVVRLFSSAHELLIAGILVLRDIVSCPASIRVCERSESKTPSPHSEASSDYSEAHSTASRDILGDPEVTPASTILEARDSSPLVLPVFSEFPRHIHSCPRAVCPQFGSSFDMEAGYNTQQPEYCRVHSFSTPSPQSLAVTFVFKLRFDGFRTGVPAWRVSLPPPSLTSWTQLAAVREGCIIRKSEGGLCW